MEFLVGGISVLLSTLVVFGYLGFIWWLDRYEREPIWMVLLTFVYGGIFGTMFGCLLSIVPSVFATGILGAEGGGFFTTVVVAPVVEEATKGLVFVVLVLTRHFDNETDGLIYGAATGLGFAAVENLMYFALAADFESLMTMVFLRTMFTALVHCISSAVLGMAIGLAVQKRDFGAKMLFLLGGYALAVLNHAVWNGLASAAGFGSLDETVGAALILLGCGFVVLASFLMFGLTQFSLKREHDVIRRFLEKEAKAGRLPAAHVDIIPYWTKRRRSDWLHPSIPKEEYLRAATLLAFRLHQLEYIKDSVRPRVEKDVAKFRAQLREMLSGIQGATQSA